jgi:hypothetical protein
MIVVMDAAEALRVVENEGLGPYAWMEEPRNIVNGAGVFSSGGVWVVVPTGERAVPDEELLFEDEGAALDRFIAVLRSAKRLRDRGHIA